MRYVDYGEIKGFDWIMWDLPLNKKRLCLITIKWIRLKNDKLRFQMYKYKQFVLK